MRYPLILLLFPAWCFGQQNSPSHDFAFKINATSLVDIFSFPSLQISLEKKVYRDISLAGEFGHQLYNLREADTTFIKPNGLKANLEVRVYDILRKLKFTKQSNNTLSGIYSGLNFFYRQNKYNTEIPFTRPNDTSTYNDGMAVNKNNRGANFVIGFQSKLYRNYLVDIYAGAGLMKKNIINTYREINKEYTIVGIDLVPLFASWNLNESSGWKANINFGIRLGIRF